MVLSIEQITAKVKLLERLAMTRDEKATKVLATRQGNIHTIYPQFFPDGTDTSVIANFIDIVARDLSEVMAPLPSVNCSATNSPKDKNRKFADTRTRIASNYLINSELVAHQYTFADRYVTYGFGVYIVELDKEAKLPRIRVEDSYYSYPEFDRYNRCVSFTKRYKISVGLLISQFPEYEKEILNEGNGRIAALDTEIDIYRYYDKDQSTIYVPSRKDLVVSYAKNPIGKMMVVIGRKPSVDDEMHGQFDDVLGIQVLRNRFAILAVEALEKSIQSPIILPSDIQDFEYGPDAIIRTNNPAGARRMEIQVPQGAFAESSLLNQEMQTGARYPQSRTGNVSASVITGQGVQALMGAFDTQVKSFQAITANALRKVIEICFEVDEKCFKKEKTIRGVDAGAPYAITYLPAKDINGDYSVEVSYGMLAGLNPAQALVFMLQAAQADWVSDDKAMRELPFNVNVTIEQEKIQVEKMRKSLLSAMEQSTLAIPQMIAQGQDPSELISRISKVIQSRQNGKSLEDAVADAYTPVELEPETQMENMQEPGMAPQGPQPMVGPPGGAELPPQGPPDIQSLLSKISGSGNASSSVTTSSRSR